MLRKRSSAVVSVLSSDNAHLEDGHLDLDRIIGLLGQALNQALHDGYQGVVATGKSQEFGPDRVFLQLHEYEWRQLFDAPALEEAIRDLCAGGHRALASTTPR